MELESQAEQLTKRQWRSHKTSAERIFRLLNLCMWSFKIIDLLNVITPNFFERFPNKESAEKWFSIVENGNIDDNCKPLNKRRKLE